MQPAVFLDRDNTLVENDGDLGDPDEVRLVEGVPAGLKALRDAGYRLVVVTNQAGVARGKFTEEGVDAVHQRIAMLIDGEARSAGLIDRFYYCPYHPEAEITEYKRDHPWRKPHPGMILQAARDMGLEVGQSWMIGDQERDIAAGRSAGCRTILISSDTALSQKARPTQVAATFGEAVRFILNQTSPVGRAAPNGDSPPPGGAENAPRRSAEPRSAMAPAVPAPSPKAKTDDAKEAAGDMAAVRRSMTELVEEIRSDRMRRADFTFIRMAAGMCQLLALLLAMLGLLQLANMDAFTKWMIGAGLVQLMTITILVLDLKG